MMLNVCLAGATGSGGFRACTRDCEHCGSRPCRCGRTQARRPGPGRGTRRAASHRSHLRLGRGGARQSLRRLCPVHQTGERQDQHPDRARARRARRGRNLRSHGERFRADRRPRAQAASRGTRLRQLCLDGRTAPEVCRSRGPAHPSMGDHRLRARRQSRRTERHRSRACVSLVESAQPRAHGSSSEDGRCSRDPRRHRFRLSDSLHSSARLRDQRGDHLRMPDQKLTIRHDSGTSARPYADGALLAIRKVSTLVGVHRGLDSVLDL